MRPIISIFLLSINFLSFSQETRVIREPYHPVNKPPQLTDLQLADIIKQNPQSSPQIATNNQSYSVSPGVSPEVGAANRGLDIPVNLFTGTPIINIPLYNLQENGLTVPISLSYNASGMKAEEVASWCGIGWTLNAGGMITRMVKGFPDEGYQELNTTTFGIDANRKGYFVHGFSINNTVKDDNEPDVFYLNINGSSYRFVYQYDAQPKFVMMPEADIKIKPFFESLTGLPQVIRFTKFEVTMPDGTKYIFGEGNTERTAELDLNFAQTQNIYPSTTNFEKYWKINGQTSAWMLTKIITPYGQEISFNYDKTNYSFFKIAESQSTALCPTPSLIDKKINKVYVAASSLSSINTIQKKVEFNKSYKVCVPGFDIETAEPIQVCSYTSADAREDIDSWSQNPTNFSASKKLIEMIVTDNAITSQDTLKYKFEYGNLIGIEDDLPTGYSLANVGNTHRKRLKLDKVVLPDQSNIRFRYKNDESGYNGKSRLNFGVDHWGFSNGATGNRFLSGLVGEEELFNTCGQGSNRATNANFNFWGSLDSIIVSTGSYTHFNYELHRARNFKTGQVYTPIGGVRIKEIKQKDLISGIETIKKYDYLMTDGQQPSGFMALKPTYRFKTYLNQSGSNSSIYDRLLAEISRPTVGYSRVVERIEDNAGNSLGKSIYYFDQDTIGVNTSTYTTTNCTTTFPFRCDTTFYLEPQNISNGLYGNTPSSFKLNTGNLIRTEVFNAQNDTLSVQDIKYLPQNLQTLQEQVARVFRVNDFNLGYVTSGSTGYFTKPFKIFSYYYGLESQTNKLFSQTGTNPIETKTTFTYNFNADNAHKTTYKGKHTQLINTATTKSQINDKHFNKSIYTAEFNFGVDTLLSTCFDINTGESYPCSEYTLHVPVIGSQARAIFEMQQRNIITPLETINYDSRITGGQHTRFGKIAIPNSQFDYYPLEVFSLAASGENYAPSMLYNRNLNDTITKSNYFYSQAKNLDFTRYGIPKKLKPFGRPIIETIFDADAILPLNNIINSDGAYTDTTSSEYANRFYGLSKQISSNKLAVNYQYYTQADQYHIGMLKSKTDKDGNVLVRYEYPNKGELLLGTAGTFTTDDTKNRAIVRTPRIATTNVYQDYDKVSTAVSYSDGSGRSLKSIAYKASPQGKDLLSSTPEYDSFGRPKKSILPVPLSSSSGQFAGNAQNVAQTFYNDTAPFSEVTQYEASPMSRVFKSIGIGSAFRPNKEGQQTFETGNFGIQTHNISGSILARVMHIENKVIKSTIIDEMANKTITYSDLDGHVLEKHVQFMGDGSQISHYLKTTYVYDDAYRLGVVLPPKLYDLAATGFINLSPFYNEIYKFDYDLRGRLISKRVPDAGITEYVYNRLDQLVMSRNARQANQNQWEFIKYDAVGRTVQTGILNSSFGRITLQTAFDNFLAEYQFEQRSNHLEGYTNTSFPLSISVVINAATIKTVNFYDDYSWNTNPALGFTQYKTPRYTNAKGLLTGNKVRKLTSTTSTSSVTATAEPWLASVMYYDDKNRLIQSQTENRFGQVNQTDIVLDFIGQVLEERTIYRKGSTAVTVGTFYTYDHAGRKLTATHSRNGTLEPLATYHYDELGRLITKKLNEAPTDSIIRQNQTLNSRADVAKKYVLILPGTTITPTAPYCAYIASGLQHINYQYNIRGNLRCINCTTTGSLDASKVFAMKLDYHEDGRYYNGLMSRQSWKTSTDTTTRQFKYDYDKSNRFINAVFKGKLNENYNENLSYDANGNIQTLNRFGLLTPTTYGRIDSLAYSYQNKSNKLTGITDYADQTKGHKDNGSATDYTYDFYDGSQKTDANKGITNIVYNYLDLPERIDFGPSKRIENVYTADGVKLSQTLINGTASIRTDYVGGLIYRNDTLQTIAHDEGIIKLKPDGSYQYQYFITDHLGNVRVGFEKLNDSVYTAQLHHYYAFGGLLEGLNKNGDWDFLYQGKEFVDGYGYDFHARGWDENTGRFMGIDPVDNYSLSGYAGMANNPISYIDPDGRNPIAIGFMVGLFASTISNMARDKMPSNVWQFLKPGIIGGISGGLGAGAPGVLAGLGQNVAYGALTGGAVGGLSDLMNGGNGSGALYGALYGGITAGLGFGLSKAGLNAQMGDISTMMAQGGTEYAAGSGFRMVNGVATITAPRLNLNSAIPIPTGMPLGGWMSRTGIWLGRYANPFVFLATTMAGDRAITKQNPRYAIMYRNMGEDEYSSFMRKGGNFGSDMKSLQAKEFWMTPEGLNYWSSTKFSKPFTVTIAVPERIIGPHRLVQQQILDNHLAGVVYPNNMNAFNRAKFVISIIKR